MPGGDREATRGCQQLFADFAAQTHDAPLYSTLAAGIADDRRLAGLLLDAPAAQRLPVLLFAAVHWLLLAEPTDPLARFYANLVPAAADPLAGAVDTFSRFCARRGHELRRLMATRRTQTNEIGRTALFVPPFGELADECGVLAHVDVGASAGLNLLVDRYDFMYEPGGELGVGSQVTVHCGTRGPVPVPARHPPVARAFGIDANPIDLADGDQARWLRACVWPDHVGRFHRLAAAIEIAEQVDLKVRHGDAVESIAAAVQEAAGDGHPVVTTSWVMNYLAPDDRRAFVTALDELGAALDVSWLYTESPALCPELPGMPSPATGSRHPTAVVVVRWRNGRRTTRHVADAHPHGRWLHWRGD